MIKKNYRHSIAFIFIFLLMLVFTLLAVIIISFGANIYKESVNNMDKSFSSQISSAFFTTKIHQNDFEGMIEVKDIDNISVLCLTCLENNISYTTYLYEYNGFLCEYFTNSDYEFDLINGTRITPMTNVSFVYRDNLLEISYLDDYNFAHSLYLTIHS